MIDYFCVTNGEKANIGSWHNILMLLARFESNEVTEKVHLLRQTKMDMVEQNLNGHGRAKLKWTW